MCSSLINIVLDAQRARLATRERYQSGSLRPGVEFQTHPHRSRSGLGGLSWCL